MLFRSGVLFAIYMIFIGILAYFKFSGIMNLILILVVLCVALTTADAAIVGIQKTTSKKWGTIISLFSIMAWNLVIPMGVMGLWTTMGNMRKYVVAICIVVAITMEIIEKKKKKNKEVVNNRI